MARKPYAPAEVHANLSPLPENHMLKQIEGELQTIDENTMLLADRIGYDGPLTLGGAEDHARMQMRRTVNECLELGKTLLIIKELTPHGGFRDRIELLGISYSAAKRFMQATLKFSKGATSRLLESAGTQAKLLELLVLDDDELKELSENGSTRGIALDDIETMTTRELRAALRREREDLTKDLAAKDKYIATQAEQIQKLHKKLSRVETETPDEAIVETRKLADAIAFSAEHEVATNLRKAFEALIEYGDVHQHSEYMLGLITQIELACDVLRGDFGLLKVRPDGDSTPLWAREPATAGVN